MSDEEKKKRERLQVTAAAAVMDKQWSLTDDEHPDFIVKTPWEIFGLELTRCFVGKTTQAHGSKAMKDAAFRRQALSQIRERCLVDFPEIGRWSLCYGASWNDKAETHIRSAIDYARISESPVFFALNQEKDSSEPSLPEFISITKSPQIVAGDLWSYMADSIGPVQISSQEIQQAIDTKALKVKTYEQKLGDIRLMIFCMSLTAAANVSIDPKFTPNLKEFTSVYFAHFPNYVAEFSCNSGGGVERKIYSFTGQTPETLSKQPNLDKIR